MHYSESELVLNDRQRLYHLDIGMDELSKDIILVGDQDRVALVASFFDQILFETKHREFVSCTGLRKGKKVSVVSTGIGTDNIDITINEIDAAFNIDLNTRLQKDTITQINFVRIGTCGLLQANVDVHSYILSEYAIGLDNVSHFYEKDERNIEPKLIQAINEYIDLPQNIIPYIEKASTSLNSKLFSEELIAGITVTSSGFYGPQGRALRLKTKTERLNESLMKFDFNGLKIQNFEMESSALFALAQGLGHEATTICLGVANRANKQFSKGYKEEMLGLIEFVLERI